MEEGMNSCLELEDDSLTVTWVMGLPLLFSPHSHLAYWFYSSPQIRRVSAAWHGVDGRTRYDVDRVCGDGRQWPFL